MMDFLKSKLNISIAIICIVLFGGLYLHKINRREIIPLNAAASEPVTVWEAVEEAAEDVPKAGEQQVFIKVHVTGAVQNPGVYELAANSRVADALEAAGGENAEADLEMINLAKIIRDEEQIKIPRMGEAVDKIGATIQNNTGVNGNPPAAEPLVNINTASRSELMSLPGVGQVTADNIIAYRTDNGNFKRLEELKKVTRIGEKTFERLKELITVD